MKQFLHASFSQWQWPSAQISACIGIDEAGRGALAGEIFVAAVLVRPQTSFPSGLRDSKLLSATQRERLFGKICAAVEAYAIATASIEEIVQYNPLQATLLAMQRAANQLVNLSNGSIQALVDGNVKPLLPCLTQAIVQGDRSVPAIAAASILAKVSRDRHMCHWARDYPDYHFEVHKGYGVRSHLEALEKFGASPIHRQTFGPVKKVLKRSSKREVPIIDSFSSSSYFENVPMDVEK